MYFGVHLGKTLSDSTLWRVDESYKESYPTEFLTKHKMFRIKRKDCNITYLRDSHTLPTKFALWRR